MNKKSDLSSVLGSEKSKKTAMAAKGTSNFDKKSASKKEKCILNGQDVEAAIAMDDGTVAMAGDLLRTKQRTFKRTVRMNSAGFMNVRLIQRKLDRFSSDRNWQQYHNPKNISMALAGKAWKLLECFQWIHELESDNIQIDSDEHNMIKDVIADIAIYSLVLCKKLNIDFAKSIFEKIEKNKIKYPEK